MEKKTKKILQSFPAENAKTVVGEVISNAMTKTAVIKITRTFKHALYGKVVKKTKKYKVHDENNECNIGDVIEACHTRLLSKTKHMVLKRIVKKSATQG